MARFVKRGNKWQYEISYKKEDGKFAKLRKSGFRTKPEAAAAASEMETELNKGYNPDKKNTRFVDHFSDWLKLYKKEKISPITYKKYLTTLENIKKYFPNDLLDDITKSKYQKVLNEFGETHSLATTKHFHMHMRACLSEAFEEKIILQDPTRKAVLIGKVAEKTKEEKFLNYDDFTKLMKHTENRLNPRYASPYMILVGGVTGLRIAELLGLTWDDVDFAEKTIDVNKTWSYKTKDGGFTSTKNASSMRKIDIDNHTIEILKKYKVEQSKLLLKNGLKNEFNLVFFNIENGSISPNAANKILKKFQQQLNINPQITFHGLRHTHASVLLYNDVDIFLVSERLGHKNVSVTQEVYLHVLNELREKNKPKILNTITSLYG